jgi:two-component system response regulator HupR/HoxA
VSEIESAPRDDDSLRYGILVVDDEEGILESLELTLAPEYRVFKASTGAAGLEILEREDIALIIVDQVMPGMSGVEFLEQVSERRPRAIRMLLTGYADMTSLVRAINDGRIYRYLDKPWDPDELRMNVRRALEAYQLSSENAQLAGALADANDRLLAENLHLRREVEGRYSFDGVIGESVAMQRVFDVMEKVAGTDATVLLTGETGTGKDVIAKTIHYVGPRKSKRFVAQNCGALPDTLLESELFGHRRGAFTGAHADKKGLFEVSDGGTIFLDEIGETEPGMQVRLLRVLQDGEIRPLGSSETLKVNVRVIAATNRDLRKDVEQGRFREDLFYRLQVVEIELPPLRERRADIPAFAHHFLERVNARLGRGLEGITNAAMERFLSWQWPGNVRELENEIERLVVLAGDEKVIGVEMLAEHIRDGRDGRGAAPAEGLASEVAAERDMNRAVDALKRHMILTALREMGNKTRAAERLGIPRQSLQKMMKRLGLRETDPEGNGSG